MRILTLSIQVDVVRTIVIYNRMHLVPLSEMENLQSRQWSLGVQRDNSKTSYECINTLNCVSKLKRAV